MFTNHRQTENTSNKLIVMELSFPAQLCRLGFRQKIDSEDIFINRNGNNIPFLNIL